MNDLGQVFDTHRHRTLQLDLILDPGHIYYWEINCLNDAY